MQVSIFATQFATCYFVGACNYFIGRCCYRFTAVMVPLTLIFSIKIDWGGGVNILKLDLP